MSAYDSYLNGLVNKNRETFSESPEIKWINPYEAEEFQKIRDRLLNNLKSTLLFKETKPYYKTISNGCKLCGQGTWSCLFITGKCNASCFYCPTSQLADEVPTSQNLAFETPEAYAEYINFFKFKGVSFSGGEPLLFFDRTLEYLKKIKEKCDPEIYVWMYTNGILADEQSFRKLAEAGLNEVRFDIGATGYKLDKIKSAKGIIPNITIEIPAIPEEKEKLKQLLPKMIKAGVTNLNLHQLRLTKHNAPKLTKRGYTFIAAEQPIVLESELASLEIINYAKEQNLNIGINYCSFFFKNRFQKAGFRKQIATVLANPDEIITEKGFIRQLGSNSIAYQTFKISDIKDLTTDVVELKLKHKTYLISKGFAVKGIDLDKSGNEETELSGHPTQSRVTTKSIDNLIQSEPDEIPQEQPLFDIWQFEYIEKGLRGY